jgi:quercetin dioxygenase-like cupin family protein
MTDQEWIKKLEDEGYTNVRVMKFEPSQEFAEHTHEKQAVHIMLLGTMTLTDKNGEKILQEGTQTEIPAGTTHSAKAGLQGCTFIVGDK